MTRIFSDDQEEIYIRGTLKRIFCHQEHSGWSVLLVTNEDAGESVKVVGLLNEPPRVGMLLEGLGCYEPDTHSAGDQFRAKIIYSIAPTTREGIYEYLASGKVAGVGVGLARAIVETFGEQTFEILDRSPEMLLQVPGIAATRAKKINSSWREQQVVRDLLVFLSSFGIGAAQAARIHRLYGEKALEIVRKEPYRLAMDNAGVDFRVADQIALRSGTLLISATRARAGLLYCLQQAQTKGHCAQDERTLLKEASVLLKIPDLILESALDEEIASGKLNRVHANGTTCIAIHSTYQAEMEIAGHIRRIQSKPSPWLDVDLDRVIDKAQEKCDITLSASQRDAVRMVFEEKAVIITGLPGTGKTTVVKTILEVAGEMGVTLCAPTGRAAKRLSETTGRAAATIHRTLGFIPEAQEFFHNKDNPLDADFVVIDEMSMVDTYLARDILSAVPDESILLMVGDCDQLPSVGPGKILSDLIASGAVATASLREIHRQAKSSRIIVNAHRLNQGLTPLPAEKGEKSDFFFLASASPESLQETVVDLVSRRLPQHYGFDPLRDIQVLTPMNKTSTGTGELNLLLQKALIPGTAAKISRFGRNFHLGDKVIQTRNNYQLNVFNGDIGFVSQIDQEEGEVCVLFDGREVKFSSQDLDDLKLAYATTVHKSQGSQFPCVVLVLTDEHRSMLTRSLVYTGVTRAQKLLVLVGQVTALERAVTNQVVSRRTTLLKNFLQHAFASGTENPRHPSPRPESYRCSL